MKILHVLTSPRAEGTPRIVLDWLKCVESEFIHELLFIHPEGELLATFQSRSEWQYYNTGFRLSAKKFPKLILLIRRIVRERKPDYVICWNTGISPWVAIGAKLGGRVSVISHAGNYPGGKWKKHTLIHTNILAFSHLFTRSKIVCCSNYIRDSYQQVPLVPRKVFRSVYNCLSINDFSPGLTWAERNIDAIMIATMERHKDHLTLLEAWKILEDKGTTLNLLLIGDGSQKVILQDYANRIGLKSVTFLGSRNDVSILLSHAKIFIFSTTVEEGFGTVLIEALASGCFVIASDVPACRETLVDGSYGTLVPPKSPVVLADTIFSHFNNTPVANRALIDNYLKKFSVIDMIDQYIEISNKN